VSYQVVTNLEQALSALKERKEKYRVIAGGTDLFLEKLPENLLDISLLAEALVIEEQAGNLLIGAAVTHSRAAASSLLRKKAQALSEACSQVGSPQVRNIGTVGGNVINAAPAADAAVALAALGAKAELIDCNGNVRIVKLEELYAGFNCSAIDSCQELLLRFIINSRVPGSGSAFARLAARKALALPMANAAAWVRVENSCLQEVRLVVAPVKPAPTRLMKTEALLAGKPLAAESWREAAEAAMEEVEVRGSLLRCSADYRRHLVGVLVARALETAAARALTEKGEA
jgi:CO/xanthine dehydrogenase FAD-binding subunit